MNVTAALVTRTSIKLLRASVFFATLFAATWLNTREHVWGSRESRYGFPLAVVSHDAPSVGAPNAKPPYRLFPLSIAFNVVLAVTCALAAFWVVNWFARGARFSLRGMAIVVAVGSLLLATWLSVFRSQHEEARGLAALRASDYVVTEASSSRPRTGWEASLSHELTSIYLLKIDGSTAVGNIPDLAPFKRLTQLRLANVDLGERPLRSMNFADSVQSLVLDNVRFNVPKAVGGIADFPTDLSILWITSETMSDELITSITSHPELATLQITCRAVTGDQLTLLAKKSSIKQLRVIAPQIDMAKVIDLARVGSFEEIHVESTVIESELQELLRMPLKCTVLCSATGLTPKQLNAAHKTQSPNRFVGFPGSFRISPPGLPR